MALICLNGLRECDGCGMCRAATRCDCCGRSISDTYIEVCGSAVCMECITEAKDECCCLCGDNATVASAGYSLCRDCAEKRMRSK